MHILIKDMKMPKNCHECPLFESKYHCHGCHAVPKSFYDIDMWEFVSNYRPSWCPLVELPPHSRLTKRIVYRGDVYNAIEAERIKALDGVLTDRYKNGFHDGLKRALQILANDINDINDAPTIIESEDKNEP